VEGLASSRVITNPQKDAFHALVQTMNDAQFQAFRKSYEGAPPAGIFGQVPSGDGGGDGAPVSTREDRIAVLESVVHNFRTLGRSDDQIKETPSWKELQQLKAQSA
jgi:hypothetical protein